MQIQNHVFLVTGGGSGLGAASATMLVANGGKVILADVSDAGEAILEQLGPNVRVYDGGSGHRTVVTVHNRQWLCGGRLHVRMTHPSVKS